MLARLFLLRILKSLTYQSTWTLLLIGFVLGVLTVLLAPGPNQLAQREPSGWQEAFFEGLINSSGEINGGQQDEVAVDDNGRADSPTTYQVLPGDSLWKIAQDHYGDGQLYGLIASANNLSNPSLLQVGQELTLPDLVESDSQIMIDDNNLYQVVKGDTLSQIAADHLGDQALWPVLYQNNLETIGHDPNSILPGQWLKIYQTITNDQNSQAEKD